ncbi:L-idonate 5-dehydrogenase [Granulosicoccus antarcticus]|uniref:L-idonate 5-dehydrogenase (NAD(P)(+)) n=1 Tax=Granulosicoccus antarcticus IMCC3135 TaxID=1192854 RepID=A0A2Z2NGT5_9GAMM|nr:L-idonate 5-dehydrogenase [Granulosicoccus antarcticus]ASJ70283.1 L-idonate 5-dehydrogenase (NAD(P)(+)) [Granulosicoccus antarcticus IMCC3135]
MQACAIHAAKDLRLIDIQTASTLQEHEVRVRYATGGICGSDIHYYHEGRVGAFAVQEPLILGHEIAGTVSEIGSAVTGLKVGQPVAINPNLPCLKCDYCLAGQTNLCQEMVFFGSAAVMPHIQGGFREELVVPQRQCVGLPDGFDTAIAAFAEPLAICLHAVNRADNLLHKSLLITGCGPIGCLAIMAARLAGVRHITATDVEDTVLDMALKLGADEVINIRTDAARLEKYESGRGHFDAAIECSGNPLALRTCLNAVRPRGTIVQTGMMPPGDTPILVNKMLSKELSMKGTFRFHEEFDLAVDLLVNQRLDVSSLLTGVYAFSDADAAFTAATDRSKHMKIQLRFDA